MVVHARLATILNYTDTVDASFFNHGLFDPLVMFFVLLRSSGITETRCVDYCQVHFANLKLVKSNITSFRHHLILFVVLDSLFVDFPASIDIQGACSGFLYVEK
jgi:hypothetical protein